MARIPAGIKYYDPVCGNQVDAQTTSSSWYQEQAHPVACLFVKVFTPDLSCVGIRATVQPVVVIALDPGSNLTCR